MIIGQIIHLVQQLNLLACCASWKPMPSQQGTGESLLNGTSQ
jgi:hypothetical protein